MTKAAERCQRVKVRTHWGESAKEKECPKGGRKVPNKNKNEKLFLAVLLDWEGSKRGETPLNEKLVGELFRFCQGILGSFR